MTSQILPFLVSISLHLKKTWSCPSEILLEYDLNDSLTSCYDSLMSCFHQELGNECLLELL